MASIKLVGGSVVGTPTEAKDTVTVGKDKQFYIYNINTLGGNDVVNLTGAFASNYYRVFTGAGNDTITGGRGVFYDGSGNDTYKFKADVLIIAGAGDDIYDGGNSTGQFFDSDTVSFQFAPSEGVGSVNSQAVRVDLRTTGKQDLGIFGKDRLINIESVEGGGGADVLVGNGFDNQLIGGQGNDKLYGFGGRDVLTGEEGADVLTGGKGGDNIRLGDDNGSVDKIRYSSKLDSGIYSSKLSAPIVWDTIFAFVKGRGAVVGDKIDLSAVSSSKVFDFIGSKAFTADADWQVRIKTIQTSGFSPKDTLVQIDMDSDTKSEMEIVVNDVTGLRAIDFIL